MSQNGNEVQVEHITPQEDSLSTIQTDLLCDREGCNKTFKSLSVLKFHQSQYHEHQKLKKKTKRDHHIEERFHCPVKDCIYYYSSYTLSKYFAKLQYLKQHYLKVHSACSFPCNQCNKSFTTKSYLRAHQQYCDLDLLCSCGQRFGSITALQTHVRRMGHESDVLSVYACRISEKKFKKGEDVSKLQSSSKNLPVNPKGGAWSSVSTSPILPKSQPPHLVAAIALSELAFAGLKRVPTVEVGVQTDPTANRRLSRKSSSPIRSREMQSLKRKQTTEMETQTRLTNLKNKIKKKGNTKRVAKCSIATDTSIPHLESHYLSEPGSHTDLIKCGEKLILGESAAAVAAATTTSNQSYIVYEHEQSFSNSSSSELMYRDICDRNLEHHFNSSGTQTTSTVSFEVIPSNEDECLPYDLFRGENCNSKDAHDHQPIQSSSVMPHFDRKEISIQANEGYEDVISLNVEESEEQSPEIASSRFESPQILIDEDDNLVSMSPSGRISPLLSRRPPSLSSQIRSSSIETQTDHDVFLSTHVQTPDDVDDIILTSTETQTGRESSSGSPSFWCTSETQTCENFSDIEPYLCSTIHTQTVGEQHPPSELFPELGNFTADMQTQTRLDDAPTLVTTHTQTSILGLGLKSNN